MDRRAIPPRREPLTRRAGTPGLGELVAFCPAPAIWLVVARTSCAPKAQERSARLRGLSEAHSYAHAIGLPASWVPSRALSALSRPLDH